MTRNRLLLGAIVIAAIIATPIAWYLISPLFITRSVDEDFPAAQAAMQDSASSSTSGNAVLVQTPEPAREASGNMKMGQTPEPMLDQRADTIAQTPEPMVAQPSDMMTEEPTEAMVAQPTQPANEPKLLRSGEFHPVEHEGTGTASIYELPDGKRVLRLEHFEVLNGPDLYVWLSAASDANNAQTILDSQYVELGRLKGNQGNQNYELPADLDVDAFNSVTIWCRRFSVNFATAPLK